MNDNTTHDNTTHDKSIHDKSIHDIAVAHAKRILSRIQEITFKDLDNNGDGGGHRVVNKAKHRVDDTINGGPVHIPKLYPLEFK